MMIVKNKTNKQTKWEEMVTMETTENLSLTHKLKTLHNFYSCQATSVERFSINQP